MVADRLQPLPVVDEQEKTVARVDGQTVTPPERATAPAVTGDPRAVQTLPYERIDDDALMQAVRLFDGEHLLVLQPFGWHLDAQHIPNAAEHFSRDGVCREHGWVMVAEYGPYVAIVRDGVTHGE